MIQKIQKNGKNTLAGKLLELAIDISNYPLDPKVRKTKFVGTMPISHELQFDFIHKEKLTESEKK